MTVAELIAVLKRRPPDAEVVIATDAEGNNFRPLSTAAPAASIVIEEAMPGFGTPGPLSGDPKLRVILWPG